MAKDYTKAAKLQNVIDRETYCELIANAVKEAKTKITVLQTATGDNKYEVAKLKLELFELERKLKINKTIADDFRNDYEVVFLPTYEKRMEECFKNFDETYKTTLDNIHLMPKDNLLRILIEGYPKENPDNKDEDKMLMFYERIRGFVNIIKGGSKNKGKINNNLKKV